MLYLVLAIASSAVLSLIMRLSERSVKGRVGMLAMNYLMCLVMAGAYTGFDRLFPAVEGLGRTLGMGVINGFLFLAGFLLLQLNVRKNGVVMSATFMKLGLLVPMAASVFLFGETPAPLQLVGFAIALAAIVLINFEKEQTTVQFRAGLIILLLAGGIGDTMAKIFEQAGNPELSAQFLFYTFGVALILCAALVAYRRERLGLPEVLYGFLIGVPNFYSARFLLRAVEELPGVVVYPTYSVGTIVVVSLAGVCLFREKLGKRQWIAIGAILVALALLNL